MLRQHGLFCVGFVVLCGLALWLWLGGGADRIALWAASEQREVQNGLARALRAVRAGEPAAWLGLLGLCFTYGFVHAAGPGHGKLIMGGYALARDVPRAKLVIMTLAGALGQAVTAILLVYAGVFVLGWGRAQMTGLADGSLALVSAVAIVAVGLWLFWRGIARWRSANSAADDGHTHGASCGHAHGPDLADIAQTQSMSDAVAVILAVAIRPCTGALFVLILTYGMGIWLAGIAGAVVMALGTAVLTLCVALGIGAARSGLAARLNGPAGLRSMAGLEILAGLCVVLVSGQVALRLI